MNHKIPINLNELDIQNQIEYGVIPGLKDLDKTLNLSHWTIKEVSIIVFDRDKKCHFKIIRHKNGDMAASKILMDDK